MSDFKQVKRARELREHASPPEVAMWSDLRDRRLGGLKFRRQQPLGPYVADFFCADARLIIELDGRTHWSRTAHDASRDLWMREQGIQTLRVPVSEFMKNRDLVLRSILRAATGRVELLANEATPHPAAAPPPSPRGRGQGEGS